MTPVACLCQVTCSSTFLAGPTWAWPHAKNSSFVSVSLYCSSPRDISWVETVYRQRGDTETHCFWTCNCMTGVKEFSLCLKTCPSVPDELKAQPLFVFCFRVRRSHLVDNFPSPQHVKSFRQSTVLYGSDIIHFIHNHRTQGLLLNQDLCCTAPVLQAPVLVNVVVVIKGPAIWDRGKIMRFHWNDTNCSRGVELKLRSLLHKRNTASSKRNSLSVETQPIVLKDIFIVNFNFLLFSEWTTNFF